VAAIIGGGGLGDIIFTGLKLNKPALIIVGAGLSALLAIVMDNVFLLVEKAVTPKGLEAQR
jgi:osmoprotectant transport system permease protein